MSSKIFVSQQSEEILRVISPATPMTSSSMATDSSTDRSRMRLASKSSIEVETYPLVQRKTSGSVGICQFSKSYYYEPHDSKGTLPDSHKAPLHPNVSTDSGVTSESSSDSDGEGYSSLDSAEGKKLRYLPRQSAVSDEKRYSIIDRSFSVDSGYTDEGYRTSGASNDFQQAAKLAKTWNKCYEFIRKLENSPDFSEKITNKINYVSFSKKTWGPT